MFRKALIAGSLIALPTVALAAPGTATGNVNMRSGPGVEYAKILTVPVGASLEVLSCSGWCQVNYAGTTGWVSGNYVSTAVASTPQTYAAPSTYGAPPTVGLSAPRVGVYVGSPPRYTRPWWDDRYGMWYDGRRWYRDGGWYDSPGVGFSFGIR